MDQFSDRLKTVLSDPESMEKIAEIAKSFAQKEKTAESCGGGEENGEGLILPRREADPGGAAPAREAIRTPVIEEALRLLANGSRERVALLLAMRPFVKEEKRQKLDQIIHTMKTLDLITSAQKLL